MDTTPPDALSFYRNILRTLNDSGVPYLVGGAYALNHYTSVARDTRDFDIFITREKYAEISQVLLQAGYRTELTHPHWLGKIRANGDVIDLVFSSGNGIAEVDEEWFDHAIPAKILDIETRLCPAEEMLWSKAYIMERERFDGADIAHLLLTQSQQMDWQRLLRRFGSHWRLLMSHLILFGFVYPAERDAIPDWVMTELVDRLANELAAPTPETGVCSGTLLSREQYLSDITQRGYEDARLPPHGRMSEQDTARWTRAIDHQKH